MGSSLAYVLFALALAGIAACVAGLMARWAPLVDVPNARSSHAKPTPRGGGVGIVVAFASGLLVIHLGVDGRLFHSETIVGLVAGAFVATLAGLADDMRPLSSAMKFGAQIVAAVLAMAGGLVIDVVPVPGLGPIALGPLAYPVTALWLVGMTNAFNFMDGLDGIAAVTAALAASFLCVIAILVGHAPVAMMALILAAASAGFLVLNAPPARIFMGDVGSQFLGFAFGALGVLLAKSDTTGTLVLVGPLLLFNFLFDTVLTAARRLWRGENPTAAHRTHLYQRLNQAGATHGIVASVHGLMVVAQGLGALWLIHTDLSIRWLVFLPYALIQAGYAYFVHWLFFRVRESISK